MTLASLIRKRDTGSIATAIPAISATQSNREEGTVARIATVAVANPVQRQNETAVTAFRWLIHYADRDPVEVTCSPKLTHDEVLNLYPDAIAAEPMASTPSRTPTDSEAAMLRALIEAIYRDDSPDDQIEVLLSALADPESALDCYRAIAVERGLILGEPDDRRLCRDCANLRGTVCAVASPGGIVSAKKGYTPSIELPHRCAGYADDPARRLGREAGHPAGRR